MPPCIWLASQAQHLRAQGNLQPAGRGYPESFVSEDNTHAGCQVKGRSAVFVGPWGHSVYYVYSSGRWMSIKSRFYLLSSAQVGISSTWADHWKREDFGKL